MDAPPPYDGIYPKGPGPSAAVHPANSAAPGPYPQHGQQQAYRQYSTGQPHAQSQPQAQGYGYAAGEAPPDEQDCKKPTGHPDSYPVAAPAQPGAYLADPRMAAAGQPVGGLAGPHTYPAPQTTTFAADTRRQGRQTQFPNKNSDETCWGFFEFVPALPLPAAIFVCLLNLSGMGVGTILGAFFMLCCGHPYRTNQTKFELFWVCLGIGFLQLITLFFAFMGFVWTVVWGVVFVACANKYYGRPLSPPGTSPQTAASTPAMRC